MKVVVLLAAVLAGIFIGPFITTPIINYLFTPAFLFKIFGIYAFTYWKSFWLQGLCGVLFKSVNTNFSKD
jgi:hypothetical protein